MSGLLFFFSRRRRHTRSTRDWSSDVCSSDLGAGRRPAPTAGNGVDAIDRNAASSGARSEERRVGKECRSRWSPYHEKKKEIDEEKYERTGLNGNALGVMGFTRRVLVRAGNTQAVDEAYMCDFFFQAEDGIRDPLVTGVQTCALPISSPPPPPRDSTCVPAVGARTA